MYLESNAKEVRSCINIVARMIDTAYSLFKLHCRQIKIGI